MLKFLDYRYCLFNNELILKLQQRFKNEAHNVYTEEMMIKGYKLMMRLQHILMDTSTGKVCKTKMLTKVNINN